MRQPTDLMVKILQSPRAQAMIDYVSNIYGDSYVGLWLFEIEGKAVQRAYDIILDLRNQLNPLTATWALDYYEDEYGVSCGEGMTYEERRQRIKTQRNNRKQANPKRICDAVSEVLGGVGVEMVENYDVNTFLIKITGAVDKSDYTAVDNVIDTMKPAHLIYSVLSDVEPAKVVAPLYLATASPMSVMTTSLPEKRNTTHALMTAQMYFAGAGGIRSARREMTAELAINETMRFAADFPVIAAASGMDIITTYLKERE